MLVTHTNGDSAATRQLLDNGFCIVPDVLPPALLQRLRDTTQQLLAEQTPEQAARLRSQGSMFHTTKSPVFAELIALPSALAALNGMGFAHPTFSDGYVISKPGHSPRLFWHYDWFAWQDPRSFEPVPSQIFLMYYLTDTTPQNGCLRVIPGSHIHHNPLHDLLRAPHSRELGEAQDANAPEFSTRPDEQDVPARAGDVVIGDARLLHATHANQTDERRTVITLWFQPDLTALPERMQAQMAAKVHPVPAEWPAEARDLVEPLLTRYTGNALPYERTLYRKRDEE